MPVRAARCDCWKVPKPGSATFSPLATAVRTALTNAFTACSASALLRFASFAIASTSSPLFTKQPPRAAFRAMRTYSRTKVKHLSRNAREIHHRMREPCDAYRTRDDVHEYLRSVRVSLDIRTSKLFVTCASRSELRAARSRVHTRE